MNNYWRPLLGAVILIGFLAFVEHAIGWRRLLTPWRGLSPKDILSATALTLFSYGLRAWRFYDYFREDMDGRFLLCVRMTLLHNFFNNLLPMRTGELSFPVLMRRYFKVAAAHSIPALLWLRLLDLHVLGLMAAAALLLPKVSPLLAVTALAAWLAWPVGLLFLGRHLRRFPMAAAWYQKVRTWKRGLPAHGAAHGRAWLWTLINWMAKLGAFAWILRLFTPVSPAGAWMGALAGDLTSVLPVHGIAGAGTYEAGVVAALLSYGVTADHALIAAVNLHLFLLGTTLAGGLVALLIRAPRHG